MTECNNLYKLNIKPKTIPNLSLEAKYGAYKKIYEALCTYIAVYITLRTTNKHYNSSEIEDFKEKLKGATSRIIYAIMLLHTQVKPPEKFLQNGFGKKATQVIKIN